MTNNITKRERHYITEAHINCLNEKGRYLTNEEIEEILKKLRNKA